MTILLVALFLRVYRLAEIPAGVDYDEAGNYILAGEIAAGQSRPVFIRAYAGREAVFYWLAAGTMWLLGHTLFAFRLAAALCGVGSVLLAYLLAREMFAREMFYSSAEGKWIPLFTAALMSVSYWHVHVSRYGFRVNAMVLLLTATMAWLWRGLRRDNWRNLIGAGVLCGLAANTYLAVRAFPLVLIVFAGWVIGTWGASSVNRNVSVLGQVLDKPQRPPPQPSPARPGEGEERARTRAGALFPPWLPGGNAIPMAQGGHSWLRAHGRRAAHRKRAAQFAVFGLAALAALAPLGVFFWRNPEYFSTRMSQTSVFDPEIHRGDLWGMLGRVTLDALGIFTVRGDSNPVYNYAQKPIYGPVLGVCFYVGLLVCLWRVFKRGGSLRTRTLRARTPYLLLLVWLPVMLLPNVLGARGVPHSLRSMGLVPAVYIVAALGIGTVCRVGEGLVGKVGKREGWKTEGLGEEQGCHAASVTYTGVHVTSPPVSGRLGGEQGCHAASVTYTGRRGLWPRLASPLRAGGIEGGLLLQWIGPVLILALLVFGGLQTYHRYFILWPQDAEVYTRSAVGVRRAAEYVSGWDANRVTPYISNDTYRHTTIAAFATNYDQLKWVNEATLVLPAGSERPALYVFDHTNPLDPVLARFLPAGTLRHRELGPDGTIGFEAYLVPPEQMPAPQPQAPGQGNLGNVLAFMGHDLNTPAVSGDVLDVTLYWRVLAPVDRDDWTFFAHLVDDRGFRWGGETFFHYPSSQWAPGEVILFRKRIAIAPGAPPGPYTLDLGVFAPSLDARLPALNADGQLSGTTVRVGPIDVVRAPAPPDSLPPIQQAFEARFGEALAFLGSDRDRSDLRPGETLALSLYWLLEAEVKAPYAIALWLEGDRHSDGAERMPLWEGDPVQGRYPLARWQPPEFVRDRYALRIPRDVKAGDYELRLAVIDDKGRTTKVVTTNGGGSARSNDFSRSLSLGTIHLHASDRLWEPPAFEHAVSARLGDSVELLGYDLDLPNGKQEIDPGETLHLTLIWRCLREMEVSYTVFTHLLDEGGQMRAQQDNPPVGGRYPTTLWAPGEVIVDDYALTLNPDVSSGTHVIEIGLYDPATMARLPVSDPTGATGDRILLGNIKVSNPP